jgi:hypothetical protein
VALVNELDLRARRGLAALDRLDRPPRRLRDRLRVLDAGAREVCFDGRRVRVADPAAFALLSRLLEEDGAIVPAGQLGRLPGCKGRLDRVRSRLPPALRGVVKGRAGRGGGYHITLPPENVPD